MYISKEIILLDILECSRNWNKSKESQTDDNSNCIILLIYLHFKEKFVTIYNNVNYEF